MLYFTMGSGFSSSPLVGHLTRDLVLRISWIRHGVLMKNCVGANGPAVSAWDDQRTMNSSMKPDYGRLVAYWAHV